MRNRWLFLRWRDGAHWDHPRIARLLFCFPCSPTRDHCGKPECDHCAVCGRAMPGKAPRSAVNMEHPEGGQS